MAAGFDEIRFPTDIVFGFSGGPKFFTTITAATGGNEQRNQNWALARATYTASHTIKSQAELDTLLEFFYTRRGKLIGFRFRDWVDYCSDMPGLIDAFPLATIDTLPAAGVLVAHSIGTARAEAASVNFSVNAGTRTLLFNSAVFGDYTVGTSIVMGGWTGGAATMNGVSFVIESIATDSLSMVLLDPSSQLVTVGTGDSVTVETNGFQLRKIYPAVAGTDYVRTITKPIVGAVRIYDDAVEESNVTVVSTSGFFEFDAGFEPADGSVITADYLFDVPVRFDTDQFSSVLEHFNISDWEGIVLVEVREL